MEDILLNILNGNWSDALYLTRNSNYSLLQVAEHIANDQFLGIHDAFVFLRTAENAGYLTINHYYRD